MKPLCGFCGGHHYSDEPHPGEAVREALAKLREMEPRVSAIEVGRKTFAEAREHVAESPDATLPSEPVTKSVVTKATKGRPRMENPSPEALRRRAYRERREA